MRISAAETFTETADVVFEFETGCGRSFLFWHANRTTVADARRLSVPVAASLFFKTRQGCDFVVV